MIKQIYDPVFTQNYYLIKAKSHKQYLKIISKEFNKNFEDEDNPDVNGKFRVARKEEQDIAIIWAQNDRVDLIVHECSHAAIWALEKRGIFVSSRESEPFCYLVQFLVKESLSNRIDKDVCIRKGL